MGNLKYILRRIKEWYRIRKISNKEFKNFKKRYFKYNLSFELNEEDIEYFHSEKTLQTEFDRHYIYHPAWAIRKIILQNPKIHVDISSTLHFCSMLSSILPVEFYDYRPPTISLPNMKIGKADLKQLPFDSNSISSLSCMHVVEHVGLGRYGDPIDPIADQKAISELKRVLGPEGDLYFVTPIGNTPKIIFNGQRIYTKDIIFEYFEDLQLNEFALIPEDHSMGGLVIDPSDELLQSQTNACGCFWFKK